MHKWMIPCNVNNFDIVNHFKTQDTVCFKRNRSISTEDEVYIYVTKPYSEIKYKGIVIKTGIHSSEVDKEYRGSFDEKTYIMVQLVKVFPEHLFTADILKKHGLGQFLNQQSICGKIEDYITEIEKSLE